MLHIQYIKYSIPFTPVTLNLQVSYFYISPYAERNHKSNASDDVQIFREKEINREIYIQGQRKREREKERENLKLVTNITNAILISH